MSREQRSRSCLYASTRRWMCIPIPARKKVWARGVPAERARLYNLYYCDRELQKDPYCSPVYAPDGMLVGFPPTLMITGACDDLCNEAEDFALRLARCGAETTIRRVPGAGHAFTIYRREGHEIAFELMVRLPAQYAESEIRDTNRINDIKEIYKHGLRERIPAPAL